MTDIDWWEKIRAAEQEATVREREACAQVLEGFGMADPIFATIAAAIRARGQG